LRPQNFLSNRCVGKSGALVQIVVKTSISAIIGECTWSTPWARKNVALYFCQYLRRLL